jgi:hypothetical protein
VGTAIVVVMLALLAVGAAIDGLLRLKKWLDKPISPERKDPPPDSPA